MNVKFSTNVMSLQQVTGILGIALIAWGAFCPIITSLGMDFRYTHGAAGIWIIASAILSLFFLLSNKFRGLLFTGICLTIIFFTLIYPLYSLSKLVSIRWGIAVVATGTIFILISGLLSFLKHEHKEPLKANENN